jgi:hypothetical protein
MEHVLELVLCGSFQFQGYYGEKQLFGDSTQQFGIDPSESSAAFDCDTERSDFRGRSKPHTWGPWALL